MPKVELTDGQRIEYQQLKGEILNEIRSGTRSFSRRAGMKLLIVRDKRLYREEFATFNEFCKEILGHSKTYANYLIEGYTLIQDFVLFVLVSQSCQIMRESPDSLRSIQDETER